MKFKAKKTDLGLGIWEVIIDGNEWKSFLNKAKMIAINHTSVHGFRKGKVPFNIALKNINQDLILREASKIASNKAYKYAISQKTNIKPMMSKIEPQILILNTEKFIINFNFDIRSEFKIKRYKDFDIKKNTVVVKKSDIDSELEAIKERFTILKNKTGKIQKGDHVIIDFVGKIDGKKFVGGDAKNYGLDIGSNTFIAGFEDALIGLKINDTSHINLTFPSDYHVNDLKSKPVTFEVKINEIKTKKIPELTDELIKDLKITNVNSIDEYKKYIKNNFQKKLEQQEKNRVVSLVLESIAKESNIIIPYSAIINQTKKLFKEFESKVKSQNLTLEEYCKRTGLTIKNINSELIIDSKVLLQNYYIFQYINDMEKFQITEEEINSKYEKLAKSFSLQNDDSRLKKYFPKEKIISEITHDKIINFLYSNN